MLRQSVHMHLKLDTHTHPVWQQGCRHGSHHAHGLDAAGVGGLYAWADSSWRHPSTCLHARFSSCGSDPTRTRLPAYAAADRLLSYRHPPSLNRAKRHNHTHTPPTNLQSTLISPPFQMLPLCQIPNLPSRSPEPQLPMASRSPARPNPNPRKP